MRDKKDISLLGILLSFFSTALSILQFFFVLSVIQDHIRFQTGMRAWLALVSIVVLTAIELSFIIYIFGYYTVSRDNKHIVLRFITVTAFQMTVFPFIDIVRFLVYLPVYRMIDQPIMNQLSVRDFIFGGIGILAAAALFTVRGKITDPLK